jgi:hypothetical protein
MPPQNGNSPASGSSSGGGGGAARARHASLPVPPVRVPLDTLPAGAPTPRGALRASAEHAALVALRATHSALLVA